MPQKSQFKPGPEPGTKYGKLTVICPHKPIIDAGKQQVPTSLCRCDCGKELVVRNYVLTRKRSPAKSCGCMRAHGQATRSAKSREYRAWIDMKTRCRRDPRYQHIFVCHTWQDSFTAFLSDMGLCPPGMTLDRIDNLQGYFPGNCRWTSSKVQNNNRRNNRIIEVNGVKRTVQQWMEFHGLDSTTFYRRLRLGWTEIDAASCPKWGKRSIS